MTKFYIWIYSNCWDGQRGSMVKAVDSLEEAKAYVNTIKDLSFGYNIVSKGQSVMRREPQ